MEGYLKVHLACSEGISRHRAAKHFNITSETSGEIYRIFVNRPEGDAPAEGWPVLYMTDGNAVIGTAVDVKRAQASYPSGNNIACGIIVTIGYPVEGLRDP